MENTIEKERVAFLGYQASQPLIQYLASCARQYQDLSVLGYDGDKLIMNSEGFPSHLRHVTTDVTSSFCIHSLSSLRAHQTGSFYQLIHLHSSIFHPSDPRKHLEKILEVFRVPSRGITTRGGTYDRGADVVGWRVNPPPGTESRGSSRQMEGDQLRFAWPSCVGDLRLLQFALWV